MADHGIIFSGAMVRSLWRGNKTQTRRLGTSPLSRCVPGDRLWGREAWTVAAIYSDVVEVRYRAHENEAHSDHVEQVPIGAAVKAKVTWPKYRPSIHMPRWASRFTLIVDDVRVERLRSISGHDSRCEGVERDGGDWRDYSAAGVPRLSARESYATLWDSLHTGEGERWDDNPEIVALTFRVERQNIDRIAA